MARGDPTIYLRIPDELKARLDKASEVNRRSLTAEVSARLQESFEPRFVLSDAAVMAVEDAMQRCRISHHDAIEHLIFAGASTQSRRPLLVLKVSKGVTLDEIKMVVEEANKGFAQLPNVILEQDPEDIWEQAARHAAGDQVHPAANAPTPQAVSGITKSPVRRKAEKRG